ncbi:MAG: YeeE/YedE family protein [candidate division WS1 bacterium]|jgi:uncharacterized membrane protein YedE/YeeE|nr:YeeE/YedE family protein [candidate division WS1 bacterium]
MLTKLHDNKSAQLGLGLAGGIVFGFLLQRGGATDYNVIINQLLLKDFTVMKLMLSAVITGMIGVHLLERWGLAKTSPRPGGWGSTALGGLIFGVGFATLGYCPGTAAGAVGEGRFDAIFGGVIGILIGAAVFAALYPALDKAILNKGAFRKVTLAELLRVPKWCAIVPVALLLTLLLMALEYGSL